LRQLLTQPKNFLATGTAKTLSDCIRSEQPALAAIRRGSDGATATAMLVVLLADFVKFFSVGKGMSDQQLLETARLILDEFYYLKPADLKIFFDRMKTGYYGETYDRMDGNVIMVNLRKYTTERIEAAESISNDLHKQLMALNSNDERYYLQIPPLGGRLAFREAGGYLRATGYDFEEVETSDLATLFTWSDAMNTKKYFAEHLKISLKISYERRASIGLIEYIKKHRPELAPELDKKPKQKHLGPSYDAVILQIEAMDLPELDKENRKRALAGLKPLSEKEWVRRRKKLKMT